eukprot:TRINITY_DN3163_c0_g1_i1.p1 TRINITY_DN3163_c0_g1~~TRINITY_DN3163_c0_g1_i1.p1  ORF type:complete len:392 (+),score=42.79 TRINITY_DN3163_c0_g1_i1:161-1177(+)
MNLNLVQTDNLYKELHAVLKEKLTEFVDDFDDSLPTYILHMVAVMNKQKDDVLNSLKFIGEEVFEWEQSKQSASILVEWIWSTFKKHAEDKKSKEQNLEAPPEIPAAKRKLEEPEEEKKPVIKLKKKERGKSILERINKVKHESPEKKISEEKRDVNIGKESPHIISLNKANNNIRQNSVLAEAEKKLPPIRVVKKTKPVPQTREVVNENVVEDAPEAEAKPDISDKKVKRAFDKNKQKIRCKKWPACPEGTACPYAHPTQMCKNFPSCKFGNKCMFIHPQIPCKFGIHCTRSNCAYTHPPRVPLSYMGTYPGLYYPSKKSSNSGKCTNYQGNRRTCI